MYARCCVFQSAEASASPYKNPHLSCLGSRSASLPQKAANFSVSFRYAAGGDRRERWRSFGVVRCQLESSASKDGPGKVDLVEPKPASMPVGVDIPIGTPSVASEHEAVHLALDDGNGAGLGGDGKFPPGGGGGGGSGGGSEGQDEDTDEFGPLLNFEQVRRELEARGVTLPSDMLEAAKTTGIRKMILENYFQLQNASWPLGNAIRSCSMLRNRMLVDQSFLFKIGTEIVIDSVCATIAEYKKRGKDFWSEFELYTADLLVGVVVNVALVGMLAPYARFGTSSASNGLLDRMARAYDALPSSVFEKERPGCRFTVQQRVGTYFYKGAMYAVVGFGCGLIGQGIANLIMTAKRSVKKSEEDIPVPPLLKSAALWGFFLAVSSNTRYQIINGLERVVEASPVARNVPAVAKLFTVGVRYANNVYGGEQFVDWARWSGCQ